MSHLGEAKVLPAEGAADAFTQSMLLCNAFASYPATTVAERAKFIVVSLAIPNEPAVLVSINKDTGEIGSAAIQGIASYRPMALKSIDARHRIYTQWKRMVSEDEGATMSVTSIQLNPKVSPDVFTSPMDSPPAQTPDGVVHF
ncbi:MAG TPA: hypothetical protein VFL13_12360 [Candidatus Baltobacteraceae bacterium]|nr:hypothetical protein [Candidatus Baltobacteraceae bacterium]